MEDILESRKRALRYQNTITQIAERKNNYEIEKNGLVIVKALYGNLPNFKGQKEPQKIDLVFIRFFLNIQVPESPTEHEEILDVTKSLRYFISDSFVRYLFLIISVP